MTEEQRFIAGRYQIGYSAYPCVRDMRLGTCAIFPEGGRKIMEETARLLNEDPTYSLNFTWRKYFGENE